MATSQRSAAWMLVAAGLIPGSAFAQDRVWSAGDGAWTNPANWNPMNVPDSFAEGAIITGAVGPFITLGASLGVGRLIVDDSLATIAISGGFGLTVHAMHLDGTIHLGGDPSPAAFTIGVDAILTGDGEIVLDPGVTRMSRPTFSTGINRTVVLGPGLTIRGGGRVIGPLTNQGAILADADGSVLEVVVGTMTNLGTLAARDGGTLQLFGPLVDNIGAGEIRAMPGGRVEMRAGSIAGGRLVAEPGGLAVVDGVVDFTNTEFHGDLDASRGIVLIQNATWFHDGLVMIGTGDESRDSIVQVLGGSLTGGGTLRLNGVPDDSNSARLTSATLPLTLDAGNTIEGVGLIDAPIIGLGRLEPGLSIGTMHLRLFGYAMLAGHVLGIDLAPGKGDQLIGDAPITLGGTLELRGTLGECESRTIINTSGGVTGAFDAIVGTPGAGRRWAISISDHAVFVRNVCAADLTGDCAANVFDFLAFQTAFTAGDAQADFDGNGRLDLFDFLAFQTAFGGC